VVDRELLTDCQRADKGAKEAEMKKPGGSCGAFRG